MATKSDANPSSSQPWLHQKGIEIQTYGTVRQLPVGLSHDTRMYSCERLNQLLADTKILFNLYKKHHWLMRGPTFYQLHLLMDKHATEQLELVDVIAERVQTLGGVAIGDPRHVAEITRIARPPNGAEEVPAMVSRLLEAHETILIAAHDAAEHADKMGDDGTNDVTVSSVIRVGELQSWFLAEHLVDTPLVRSLVRQGSVRAARPFGTKTVVGCIGATSLVRLTTCGCEQQSAISHHASRRVRKHLRLARENGLELVGLHGALISCGYPAAGAR